MSVKENLFAIFFNSFLYKSISSKSWLFNTCLSIIATNSPFKISFCCNILFFTSFEIPLNTNSFTFVSSLHIEIDLSGIIFSRHSKNTINLWLETKKTDTLVSFEVSLIRSCIFFLDFGTKPKKVNSDIGSPDNWRLDIIDDGPGIEEILILFSIQNFTKL